MNRLPHDRYHAELERQTEQLATAVEAADLAAPVPTCPEWTLAELAAHVGRAHRWAAMLVEQRAAGPVSPEAASEDLADPARLTAWLRAGARRLGDAVRAAGPSRPVWSWADDQTAGFWLRRITHDTLIHRVDADLATGGRGGVAPDLAADGVSDFLSMLACLSGAHSDPIFASLRGTGETLRFHPTDEGVDGTWSAVRTPSGVEVGHAHLEAQVVVRARAEDLLLVLNRRIAPADARLDLRGDEALFRHWVDNSTLA